ncbi:MAG: DinB family protein [Planctomycetaceae bacterium]
MSMHLAEMAKQIRNQTIVQLKAAPEDWLRWAPPGTSNHILWHAGHSLWVQDALCVEPLTGASELPAGWEHSFGADCRPVRETQHWPGREEVLRLLERQLVRLQDLTRERAEQLKDSALVAEIIHGLHDEARHQGEMFLLFKLRRAQGGWRGGPDAPASG